MRINVGCGGRVLKGYTGVDIVKRPGADIIAPADKIPLPDGSCEEVLAVHVFEHLYRWQCEGALKEWYRLLKPGGLLALEMPDLIKACRNILNGVKGKHPDQMGMWALHGDPRQKDEWMNHRWSWTFSTLAPLVVTIGFVDPTEQPTEFHAAGGNGVRDFRLEARKPGSV